MTPTRSRGGRALVSVASALALATLAWGCIVVQDDRHHDDWYDEGGHDDDWDEDGDPLDEVAAVVTIDEDAAIGAVEPGIGAGIFVEVTSDGRWSVRTACDTLNSGYSCDFQLFLVGDGIALEAEEELEQGDEVDDHVGELDLYFLTDADFDGVTFTTSAGASVTLTAYLDGASQPEFVYWIGDGIQNEGAPTNPVTFAPR